MKNLWPPIEEIIHEVNFLDIIEEQAELLGQITHNRVFASFKPCIDKFYGKPSIAHSFEVFTQDPSYQTRLFWISHHYTYPFLILLEDNVTQILINNRMELETELSKIFSSERVKRIIKNLYTRSK